MLWHRISKQCFTDLRVLMKLTVISLEHCDERGFDSEPLEEFCETHIVRAWVDHFFVHDGKPELAIMIEYDDHGSCHQKRNKVRHEREPRRELSKPAKLIYDRLHEWRSLRARQDGVPVYVVFSNRELAGAS